MTSCLGREASPGRGSARSPLPHGGLPKRARSGGLQRGGSSRGAFRKSGGDPVTSHRIHVEGGDQVFFFFFRKTKEKRKRISASPAGCLLPSETFVLYTFGGTQGLRARRQPRGKGRAPAPAMVPVPSASRARRL